MRIFSLAAMACLSISVAFAAIPATINYQSFLTDPAGSPIDDPAVTMTFSLYTVPVGGVPVWSETQVVGVDQGLLSVELGALVAFPASSFDIPTYLGVTVGADTEMFPRRALTSVASAIEAGNAMTLEGQSASSLNQAAHVTDTANPHNVTAAQTGAASTGALSSHVSDASAHHSRYTNSEAVTAILSADGPGSGLNADLLDGLSSSSFLQSTADWGRPGVAGSLFEGAQSLTSLYVNEGQVNSISGTMIQDNTIRAADIFFPLNDIGTDLNGGLLSLENTSGGTNGNEPMGLLGQASGNPGLYRTFGVAGLAPGLGTGAPVTDLPSGNKYGVAGVVDTGIGTAGLSNGGSGIGVLGDGTVIGVKGVGINGPTKGYLGVQGQTDFDGEVGLNIPGIEIGVLGLSSGGSVTDNYAFYGVSNNVGIYAEGANLAGQFVGDIETDRVVYSSPRTHYYSVGDGDFKSALGNGFSTSFGQGGAYMTVSGTQLMVAGLHLPDGATITEFRAYVDDAAAGNLSISLSRLTHAGNGFTTVASVASSGSPGLANYTDSTIAVPVVNNELYSYHVRVFGSNWPGNNSLKIKGAVVVYTIDEAS